MLCPNEREAKQRGGIQVAIDRNEKNAGVWVVPESTLPCQGHANPWELLTDTDIMKIKRSYGIGKKTLSNIMRAYKNKSKTIDLPPDDIGIRFGVKAIEKLILEQLKTFVHDSSAEYIPSYTPEKWHDIWESSIFLGKSGSGKTSLAIDLLLSPDLINVPLYVFTVHSRTDKAMKKLLAEKPRGTLFLIDFQRMSQDEVYFDVLTDFKKGSLILFDDIEGLPGKGADGYSLRKSIVQLSNQIQTVGRHAGCCAWYILHSPYSGREFTTIIKESARAFILFSHGNRSEYEAYLQKVLKLKIKRIRQIWERAKGSRWVMFQFSSPSVIVSRHHVEMY